MSEKRIAEKHHTTFEKIRQFDEDGNEFWSARDLAPLLEYQDWRNFMQVVDKARTACAQSGKPTEDHFGDATKMVPIGSGAQRPLSDVHLSRYACYLIVQNADPAFSCRQENGRSRSGADRFAGVGKTIPISNRGMNPPAIIALPYRA